jgi:hypothetical protein
VLLFNTEVEPNPGGVLIHSIDPKEQTNGTWTGKEKKKRRKGREVGKDLWTFLHACDRISIQTVWGDDLYDPIHRPQFVGPAVWAASAIFQSTRSYVNGKKPCSVKEQSQG